MIGSIPVSWYLLLSAVLFTIGAGGVLIRRNAIVVLMCIEMMMNAVNLSFVAFSRHLDSADGQIFVFMIMTVAAVEVSRDLAHAKIYITALTEEHDSDVAAAVLNHAAGFLRGRLGKRMVMRSIPQLHFVYDHAQRYGAELSALIDAAVDEDRERRNEPVTETRGQDPE